MRAALLTVGVAAIGLVQPSAAGAVVIPPEPGPVQQGFVAPSGASILIRESGVRETNEVRPREDDASVDAEADDDPAAPEPAVAGSRDYRWTAADVLYMRDHASPRARCIIDREVGGFGYDPWRRGLAGERGPVQLHPRGLLPEYLAWSGGQAPENPYYAVPFLEYKLRQGQGRNWSPVRLGLC